MTVRNCCASRLAKSKQQVELRGKKRRFWTKVIFFASFQIQDGGVGTTLFNIDTGSHQASQHQANSADTDAAYTAPGNQLRDYLKTSRHLMNFTNFTKA